MCPARAVPPGALACRVTQRFQRWLHTVHAIGANRDAPHRARTKMMFTRGCGERLACGGHHADRMDLHPPSSSTGTSVNQGRRPPTAKGFSNWSEAWAWVARDW